MAFRGLLGSVLATALLSLALPVFAALADSPPERASPEVGAVLERPPAAVEVWVAARLDASKGAELKVVHIPSGRRVDRGGDEALDSADPQHLRVTLEPDLAPGRHVVSWEATGVDGHPTEGSYAFTVAPLVATNEDRVPLMLAVFGVAVFAVSVGGLGYLFRRQLGLVAPPPEQPPSEHH